MKLFGRTKAMRKQFALGAGAIALAFYLKPEWYIKFVQMVPGKQPGEA